MTCSKSDTGVTFTTAEIQTDRPLKVDSSVQTEFVKPVKKVSVSTTEKQPGKHYCNLLSGHQQYLNDISQHDQSVFYFHKQMANKQTVTFYGFTSINLTKIKILSLSKI